MAEKADNYDSSEIRVLEGLEPVRLRPGMYIGSTGYDGLHHLIKEIADNSIDEAIAGFANRIDITILEDGGVRVDDNGRGIPVDIHPKTGKSTLETVLTVLHAGGKFAVPKPARRKGNSTCSPMEKEVSLSGEGAAGPRPCWSDRQTRIRAPRCPEHWHR